MLCCIRRFKTRNDVDDDDDDDDGDDDDDDDGGLEFVGPRET